MENTTSKSFIKRDAINRAARSLWQGVGIDILVAIALVVGAYVATADGWGAIEWTVLAFSVFKSVTQAIVSYITRRYVDTSRRLQKLPTPATPPLPPAPAPEPPLEYDGGAGPGL